jgi:uridine phosphorylase
MEELITPAMSIENFIDRRGITVDDIGVAPTVIVSWGHRVIEEMAAKIEARPSDHWLYGKRQSFFRGDIEGTPISLVELPVGAPGTVMIMEEMIACGAQTFIGLGWAGSLQTDVAVGSFIIPTSCLSEEGTSRHYIAEPSKARPDPGLVKELELASREEGAQVMTGYQWTTDAPFRELRKKIVNFRKAGVLGVDMETSAMYAVGQFRSVRVCNLLVVSDVLDDEWKPGFGSISLREANAMALRVVLRVAAAR